MLDTLNQDELLTLYSLVYTREYNPNHPDDYGNAGGFHGHWEWYDDEEKAELIKLVRFRHEQG